MVNVFEIKFQPTACFHFSRNFITTSKRLPAHVKNLDRNELEGLIADKETNPPGLIYAWAFI